VTINELLHAGNAVYGYDESDKAILRQLAKEDPDGLRLAFETDPLISQHIKGNRNVE
jgi:hypothetical protein